MEPEKIKRILKRLLISVFVFTLLAFLVRVDTFYTLLILLLSLLLAIFAFVEYSSTKGFKGTWAGDNSFKKVIMALVAFFLTVFTFITSLVILLFIGLIGRVYVIRS